MRLACWLLFCLAATVSGHAIFEAIGNNQYPQRPGISGGTAGVGIKRTPFADAASIANNGCGGPLNSDPGVQQPTLAFQTGDQITLSWKMTIPHPNDHLATTDGTGVRIAVHYTPGDSFSGRSMASSNSGRACAATPPTPSPPPPPLLGAPPPPHGSARCSSRSPSARDSRAELLTRGEAPRT